MSTMVPRRCGEQTVSAVDAIAGRRSIRRFLPDAIERTTIEAVLALASRAASGVNAQPWNVYVATGESRDTLAKEARSVALMGADQPEYDYAPKLWEPYVSRRRKIGFDLYSKYGVARDDYPARNEAALRNFDFFGAPVGLFFTMDRRFKYGQWLDMGIFMDSVMLAARAHGLDTCAQEAWCRVGTAVRAVLRIPMDQALICGMSLGYADESAPENHLATERSAVSDFVIFRS
ncbi:nitroreductase [Dactylosporangium sp. CA-233914]|uniref:nitroreductase n=1 Tax=Dactylosporangium sp. CA-233914 TaxID=3239934 RepID=UPI003D8A92B0